MSAVIDTAFPYGFPPTCLFETNLLAMLSKLSRTDCDVFLKLLLTTLCSSYNLPKPYLVSPFKHSWLPQHPKRSLDDRISSTRILPGVRLLTGCSSGICNSGILCGVDRLLDTDVWGQCIRPILEGQTVQLDFRLYWITRDTTSRGTYFKSSSSRYVDCDH